MCPALAFMTIFGIAIFGIITINRISFIDQKIQFDWQSSPPPQWNI
jgi:hypothetical protein